MRTLPNRCRKALFGLTLFVLASAAPRSAPATQSVDEVRAAQQALQQCHAADTLPALAEHLTDESAALAGAYSVPGLSVMGRATKDERFLQPFQADLNALLKQYGLDEASLTSVRAGNAPRALPASQGRAFLRDLGAFVARLQEYGRSANSPLQHYALNLRTILPAAEDCAFHVVSATEVGISPNTGVKVSPSIGRLAARREGGRWRIDLGTLSEAPHRLITPELAALLRAIEGGDVEHAGTILHDNPTLVNAGPVLNPAQGVMTQTPLNTAITRGRAIMVRLLIARGADVNDRSSGETSLYQAAFHHRYYIAALLLAAGADVNAVARAGGETPLHCALLDGDAGLALLLSEHGGRDPQGLTLDALRQQSHLPRLKRAAQGRPQTSERPLSRWGNTPVRSGRAPGHFRGAVSDLPGRTRQRQRQRRQYAAALCGPSECL